MFNTPYKLIKHFNKVYLRCTCFYNDRSLSKPKVLEFLVDTGAESSLFKNSVLRTLGYTPVKTERNYRSPLGIKVPMYTTYLNYFGICDHLLNDILIGSWEDKNTDEGRVDSEGITYGGILGMDILNNFNIKLDLDNKFITLHKRKNRDDVYNTMKKKSVIDISNILVDGSTEENSFTEEQEYILSLMTQSQKERFGMTTEGIHNFVCNRLHK